MKYTSIEQIDPNKKNQHDPGAKLDNNKFLAGILDDFSLALQEVVKVGTFGAKKYSRGGWQYVSNGIERYTDAFWRHLLEKRHKSVDEETGLPILAHIAWNALVVLELTMRKCKYNNCILKPGEGIPVDKI